MQDCPRKSYAYSAPAKNAAILSYYGAESNSRPTSNEADEMK